MKRISEEMVDEGDGFPGKITLRMVEMDRRRSFKFRLFKLLLFVAAVSIAAIVISQVYQLVPVRELNFQWLNEYLDG